MIYLFTHENYQFTTKGLRRFRDMKPNVKVRSYKWLLGRQSLRAGVVVFTDFDRLIFDEHLKISQLAKLFAVNGVRVLNDPARVQMRYELLHNLYKTGWNPYQVWRATSFPQLPDDIFPVFLKSEGAHSAPLGGLLASQAELDDQIERIKTGGVPLHHILVTQFIDAPIREGVWQRNTHFCIGNKIFAGTPVIEDSPFVKYGSIGLATDEDHAQVIATTHDDSYDEDMKRVFAMANINYGRADYVVVNGKPVIFEINTNPTLPYLSKSKNLGFVELQNENRLRVLEAFCDLDSPNIKTKWNKKTLARISFP